MSYVHLKRVIPVIIALVILVLSLLPRIPSPPVTFHAMDKAEHVLAYAVLSWFVFNAFETTRISSRTALFFMSVLICTLYGGLIEIAQSYTGRYSEWLDLAANAAGSLSGCLFFLALRKIRPIR